MVRRGLVSLFIFSLVLLATASLFVGAIGFLNPGGAPAPPATNTANDSNSNMPPEDSSNQSCSLNNSSRLSGGLTLANFKKIILAGYGIIAILYVTILFTGSILVILSWADDDSRNHYNEKAPTATIRTSEFAHEDSINCRADYVDNRYMEFTTRVLHTTNYFLFVADNCYKSDKPRTRAIPISDIVNIKYKALISPKEKRDRRKKIKWTWSERHLDRWRPTSWTDGATLDDAEAHFGLTWTAAIAMTADDPASHLVCVVGPTAVGKTTLAVELAQRFGGEIVNADSRQVYRGMTVGTAKPTPEEQAVAPHHLVDILDPPEPFGLSLFLTHADDAIRDIRSRGAAAHRLRRHRTVRLGPGRGSAGAAGPAQSGVPHRAGSRGRPELGPDAATSSLGGHRPSPRRRSGSAQRSTRHPGAGDTPRHRPPALRDAA